MKKIKIKFIIMSTMFTFAILVGPNLASANVTYYSHLIPYVVSKKIVKPMRVTLTASPNSMTLPENTTALSWVTAGDPESCSAFGEWSGSKDRIGGSENMTGLTAGSHDYGIICFKNGTSSISTVTVVVNPENGDPKAIKATLKAVPNYLSFPGGTSTLTWGSQNATSCDGTNFNPNSATAGDTDVDLNNTTTYQVICIDGDGNFATASAQVVVGPKDGQDPKTIQVTLTPEPANVPYGGGSAKLTWSSTNATFCNDIQINASSGQPASLGISTGGATQGTTNSFFVGAQTSYQITCKADGLEPATAYATIGILPKDGDPCPKGMCPPGEGKKQCSDGKDNVDSEDTLIDDKDPGCYTNGVYNPNDDDEKNSIKIKEIEI